MHPYGNPTQPVPKRSRRNPTEEVDSDEEIALWNATQARNIQSSSAGYVIRLNGRIITPEGSFPDPDPEARAREERVQQEVERLTRNTDSEKSTIPDADFLDLTVEDDDDDWEVPVHMENPWPDVPDHDDDDIWI